MTRHIRNGTSSSLLLLPLHTVSSSSSSEDYDTVTRLLVRHALLTVMRTVAEGDSYCHRHPILTCRSKLWIQADQTNVENLCFQH